MIENLNLFQKERASGVPMEFIVSQLKANTKIEPETRVTNKKPLVFAFRIVTAARKRRKKWSPNLLPNTSGCKKTNQLKARKQRANY
jgi:hypothetical protein